MGAAVQNVLGAVVERFFQNGGMPAVGKRHVMVHGTGGDHRAVHHALDGGAIAPADLADIGGVGQDRLDRTRRPLSAAGGGNAAGVQPFGDGKGTERTQGPVGLFLSVDVPVEDLPDHLSLLGDDAQGIALLPGKLVALIAVSGLARDVLPLRQGGAAAPLEPSVDGLVLPAAHK